MTSSKIFALLFFSFSFSKPKETVIFEVFQCRRKFCFSIKRFDDWWHWAMSPINFAPSESNVKTCVSNKKILTRHFCLRKENFQRLRNCFFQSRRILVCCTVIWKVELITSFVPPFVGKPSGLNLKNTIPFFSDMTNFPYDNGRKHLFFTLNVGNMWVIGFESRCR